MRRLLPLLLLTACDGGFAPSEVGARPFTPPSAYREVWAAAEACTGLQGDYDRIRWYVVPEVRTFEHDGLLVDGLYDRDERTITLTGWVLDVQAVVRHEMIHALGVMAHTDVPFRDPCRATWDSRDPDEPLLELPPELLEYKP